ncbi:alpha/beta fold hydrolase [Citrobacter braakii]|uniref:alpha/beta fold hydrolase n=1 Tax=Citrobacter braakii TaxID=57706 RepID=UPI002A370A73|nr:alpha/beta hydrolase [Citrobacter braakii]
MQHQQLPVVLIPGFMLDETLWDEFIRVYPDERCFIRASLARGQNIAEMARYIVSGLPHRFILAGFSLGGYVARAIAEAYPERTVGMILIATSLREDPPEQRKLLDAASRVALSGDFNGISPGAIKRSLHPLRQGDTLLIQRIREMGKRLGSGVFRAQALLERNDITTRPFTGPVKVFAADEDRLRGYEEVAELAHWFGSNVEVIEGSGHLVPLEQPDQLARSVSDWLDSVGL